MDPLVEVTTRRAGHGADRHLRPGDAGHGRARSSRSTSSAASRSRSGSCSRPRRTDLVQRLLRATRRSWSCATWASSTPRTSTTTSRPDGYQALYKVLAEHDARSRCSEEILASGLRGRGGAGFPTGHEVEVRGRRHRRPTGMKYFICNGDEGDPGAFMDCSVLEGDPHAVFEGMAIGGYAIGADQGYIYVRAEYPLAIRRLKIALQAGRGARPHRRQHHGLRLLLPPQDQGRGRAPSSAAKRPP